MSHPLPRPNHILHGLGHSLAVIAFVLTSFSCGGKPVQGLRVGMDTIEVKELMGEPGIRRKGVLVLDSSRTGMVVRGSDIPILVASPQDNRVMWVYDMTKIDSGVAEPKGKKGRGRIVYTRTYNFCVVFDPMRKRVMQFGYYPVAVSIVR